MRPARNTQQRDRHRRTIAIDEPPCGICGGPIDYTLSNDDPNSFVVDHIVPYSISHDDTLDNKQAAHRACNAAKSDHMPDSDQWMHVDQPTWL